LEERMTVLEARVEALEVKTERNADIGTSALREALEARLWHKHNVELLRAVRDTQTEHSETLAEHARRLDAIDGKLGRLTVGMHDIQLMLKHLIEREGSESAAPTAG
jgi:hypothetical protein